MRGISKPSRIDRVIEPRGGRQGPLSRLLCSKEELIRSILQERHEHGGNSDA